MGHLVQGHQPFIPSNMKYKVGEWGGGEVGFGLHSTPVLFGLGWGGEGGGVWCGVSLPTLEGALYSPIVRGDFPRRGILFLGREQAVSFV